MKSDGMTTKSMRPASAKSFASDEDRWRAVMTRDKTADGKFFYSVKTTGVYCRPCCAARLAKRENVAFYLTPADAERAGFRACKRCKPKDASSGHEQLEAVAKACKAIMAADDPPGLEALAASVAMSPSHFHRMFKSLTGLTPKAYANGHRSQRVREELLRSESVTSAIYAAGFNSNGRFYATSSRMLGMKPGNFRGGGKGARIRFVVGKCSLGSILVASSQTGICSIMLGDDAKALAQELQDRFPRAEMLPAGEGLARTVAEVIAFVEHPATGLKLPLDVQGTAFQERVWQKLCEIPCGRTSSYAEIAKALGRPKASRAVAQACAANPIAVAIPCHRVVRSDGSLSGYRWGVERKARLLETERKQSRPVGRTF